MNNPIVSIIVPVYNAEKTLTRTIESVLNQTCPEWECLLIDDGSTDESGAICDSFCKLDKRFLVVHKQNGGVATARNCGIENARGKWITFLDSDDELDVTFIEDYLSIKDDNPLLICGGLTIWGEYEDKIGPESSGKVNVNDELSKLWNHLEHFVYWYSCSKFYDKDIVMKNNIRFRTDMFYSEDFCFFCEFLRFVDSFYNISQFGYRYFQVLYKGFKFKMKAEQVKVHWEHLDRNLRLVEEKCGVVFDVVRNDLHRRLFRNFWGYLITLDNRKQFVEELAAFRRYKSWRQFVKNADGSKMKKKLLLYAPARLLYVTLKA